METNWLQYVNAFSTLVIGVLVVVIGIAQWRTAHQRAVLDLFEKRMAIFNKLSGVVRGVVTFGGDPP